MSSTFGCGLLGLDACNSSTTARALLSVSSSRTPTAPTSTDIAPPSSTSDSSWFTSTTESVLNSLSPVSSTQPLSFVSDVKLRPSTSTSTTFVIPTSTTTTSFLPTPTDILTTSTSQTSASPAALESVTTQTLSAASLSSSTMAAAPQSASADTQPQGWTIALIVLAIAALLASVGACAYVYFSRRWKHKRTSLSQDVIERYRDDGATNSSLAMLPGSPRTPLSSSLDTPSVYTTSSAQGSWTNLPLLTPTLTPGFDAQSQQASVHDAAYYQSSIYIVPSPEDQSFHGSRSTSPGTVASSRSHTATTSASNPATARTFVTGATAGSRPPPIPPHSVIPLPPPPIPQNAPSTQSSTGHARANTQASSKTFDTAATAGSVGVSMTDSAPPVSYTRTTPASRPLPIPSVSGHARADTQTSNQTFATAATQGSHSSIPSRRRSMPSGLVPHDPFVNTRPAPLAVAGFPHWPPTPSISGWPVTPQSPPPPPPPPVPPVPQHHREATRVSGKSTASTTRSPPSYHTVASP